MENRLKNIGKNIRQLRKFCHIQQIELAITVGIDRSYLSGIENGKVNPSINVLFAIADVLEVPITDLFK